VGLLPAPALKLGLKLRDKFYRARQKPAETKEE